jgi:RNA polymerase sigma-70 factor (ECF subfamily)
VDDALQDVFLRLFRSLRRLRDPNALRTFVIRVTVRVVADELRRRKLRGWLRLTRDGDLSVHTAEVAAADAICEVVQRFYSLLDKLGATDRICFVLRHIEQMDLGGMADAVGVSLATVKRRLRRAEERVGRLIERDPVLAKYFCEHPQPWRRAGHAQDA